MIKNYFLITFRNLWRGKFFSFIKIAGLGLGLTLCMLILLYIKDEVSFDRFHEQGDHIYRVIQTWANGKDQAQKLGNTNSVMGEAFANEIPEIQQYVRVNGVPVTVKQQNDVLTEIPFFVDENYLSVFTFPLISGNIKDALSDPYSVVISERFATKYFGNIDVTGKTLQIKMWDQFENFNITAVVKNTPQNSTLISDLLMPFKYYQLTERNTGWLGGSLNTFLLISPDANIKAVENKMQEIFDRNTKEKIDQMAKEQGILIKISLSLQPLFSIHLDTEAGPDTGMSHGNSPAYSYILGCIAIFVLIIASINFINLSVGQSLKRSKEIGIRKVCGSTRSQLIMQFLTESFVTSLIAFIIAIFLTILILPFFNSLADKKLSLAYLSDGSLYVSYFILLLFTSFIAGLYPSFVLSAFQPVKVLFNRQRLLGKSYLTRGLIVLQFGLAIFFIIGTIAINSQLNFIRHKDLGYDFKNLVSMNLPLSKLSDHLPALFKNELNGKASIIGVASKNRGRNIIGVKVDGKQIATEHNKIDDKFLPTFKIGLLAGRNFSPGYPSDSVRSVIVNESFINEAGWSLDNAIGKTVDFMDENRTATLVGIIKNYNSYSLKEKISPELYAMDPMTYYGEIWVRIKPENIPQTLSLLGNTYKKLVPLYPYSYRFMDDVIANNYRTDEKWKQIISIASVLFIFISVIGLLGLVSLSIGERTKEIGIRKILGAAVSKIIFLISKEFFLLIAVAIVVAVPFGYLAVNKWLLGFAYHIRIGWWIFGLAAILVTVIVLLTMSFMTIKAGFEYPVKSLRTE